MLCTPQYSRVVNFVPSRSRFPILFPIFFKHLQTEVPAMRPCSIVHGYQLTWSNSSLRGPDAAVKFQRRLCADSIFHDAGSTRRKNLVRNGYALAIISTRVKRSDNFPLRATDAVLVYRNALRTRWSFYKRDPKLSKRGCDAAKIFALPRH